MPRRGKGWSRFVNCDKADAWLITVVSVAPFFGSALAGPIRVHLGVWAARLFESLIIALLTFVVMKRFTDTTRARDDRRRQVVLFVALGVVMGGVAMTLAGDGVLLPLLVLPIVAAFLWRARAPLEIPPSTACPHCGYDRSGIGARGKCPECGRGMWL